MAEKIIPSRKTEKLLGKIVVTAGVGIATVGGLTDMWEASNQRDDFKGMQDLSAQVQTMPTDTPDHIAQFNAVQKQISDLANKGTIDNNRASMGQQGVASSIGIITSGWAMLANEKRRRKKEAAKNPQPPTAGV